MRCKECYAGTIVGDVSRPMRFATTAGQDSFGQGKNWI